MAYLSPIAFQKIEDIIPQLFDEGKTPFILILDRITDVRNLGAIARSAYCAGVHAIVIPAADNAPINPASIIIVFLKVLVSSQDLQSSKCHCC